MASKTTKTDPTATIAFEVERGDTTVPVEIHVPTTTDNWPVESIALFEGGKAMQAALSLLSPADKAKLFKLRLTAAEFADFISPKLEELTGGK